MDIPDKLNTYLQPCLMDPRQIGCISKLVEKHPEWGITMTINQIPGRESVVTFEIPSEGVDEYDFYRQFYRTINTPESIVVNRERGR